MSMWFMKRLKDQGMFHAIPSKKWGWAASTTGWTWYGPATEAEPHSSTEYSLRLAAWEADRWGRHTTVTDNTAEVAAFERLTATEQAAVNGALKDAWLAGKAVSIVTPEERMVPILNALPLMVIGSGLGNIRVWEYPLTPDAWDAQTGKRRVTADRSKKVSIAAPDPAPIAYGFGFRGVTPTPGRQPDRGGPPELDPHPGFTGQRVTQFIYDDTAEDSAPGPVAQRKFAQAVEGAKRDARYGRTVGLDVGAGHGAVDASVLLGYYEGSGPGRVMILRSASDRRKFRGENDRTEGAVIWDTGTGARVWSRTTPKGNRATPKANEYIFSNVLLIGRLARTLAAAPGGYATASPRRLHPAVAVRGAAVVNTTDEPMLTVEVSEAGAHSFDPDSTRVLEWLNRVVPALADDPDAVVVAHRSGTSVHLWVGTVRPLHKMLNGPGRLPLRSVILPGNA